MDIKQLRNFIAIVEEGSFSRAASRVHIAQPALSLQIRKLEDELQTQLLLRGPNGVQMTQAGEVMLIRAKTILKDIAQTQDEVRSLGNDPKGIVRIGLPGTISGIVSVPLIARARQIYPDIKIIIAEAMSGFVREWLFEGRIDLAILYNEFQDPGIVSKALLKEELVILVPFSAAQDYGSASEALDDLPIILPSDSHGLRSMLDRNFRARGINLNPEIEVDSYSNIKSLVANGFGCSILPYHAVADDAENQILAIIRFDEFEVRRSAHLVYRSGRPFTRATEVIYRQIQLVIDQLLDEKIWTGATRL